MFSLVDKFDMPGGATTGVQSYDLEGTRRKKTKKSKGIPQPEPDDKERVSVNADMNGMKAKKGKLKDDTHKQPRDMSTKKPPKANADPNEDEDERVADPNADDAIATDPDGDFGGKAEKVNGGSDVKFAIAELDEPALQKFMDKKSDELNVALTKNTAFAFTKGVYDVQTLAGLITQLKYMADGAARERQVEGDSSAIPERLRDEAATLLQLLSDMASEEAQELNEGTTAEDVIADTTPTMQPGLYRADVGTFAKELRKALGIDTELAKAGARNSAKDLETIQKVHDAACELGADCGGPHDQDGKDISKETDDMATANKADTVAAEGNKRGSAVTDPKLPANSDNSPDAERTGEQSQEKPNNNTKKSKARMDEDELKRRKARMDEDEDEDEDEDDDGDEDDVKSTKKKASKAKKAKKSFDAEDLAKVVATAVATAMASMLQKVDNSKEQTVIPRVRPNLMAVGKDGDLSKVEDPKSRIEALRKSVTPAAKDRNDSEDNGTVTLIKAIHANRIMVPQDELNQLGFR